jgi:hypothetical protein
LGTFAGDVSVARGLANALPRGALGTTFGEAVRTYPVGTVCRDTQALLQAFGPTFGQTIRAYPVGPVFGDTQALLQALGPTFGETVGTYSVGPVCGDAQTLLQALGSTFGETVGTYPVGPVCGDAQTLLQALGTAFSQRRAAKTDKRFDAAVLGFAKQGLRAALWQGECAGGQAGQEQCGDHLLFHVQAPREGGK